MPFDMQSTKCPSLFDGFLSKIIALVLALAPATAFAELAALSDNDLSEVDGAGVGFVMEDFVFSHENSLADNKVFRITGVKDSAGNDVTINVDQMYIARSGSNYGSTLDPVNLGRLNNPYEIDLLDGNTIGLPGETVLEIAAPKVVDVAVGYDCLDTAAVAGSGTCSSRPSSAAFENGERPDFGLELEVAVTGQATTNLNVHMSSAVFDGSHLRLWGEDDRMAAEYRLNFYTPELEVSTCSQVNEGCGSSLKMRDFQLELALGNSFQPLYLGVDNVTGGMTIQIEKITHEYMGNIDVATGQSDGSAEGDLAYAFYDDFYSNSDYRSNVYVGEMEIGGTSLGSAKVEGMLIQYLDVKLRDLDP
jgi:hypothetical protein